MVHHPDAQVGENGHPLYVHPAQRGGRIDNPHLYRTLYVAEDPACAVVEAFSHFRPWPESLFDGPPIFPGSRRRLAVLEIDPARSLDLDDPAVLQQWDIRPSAVVTRQRRVTQEWAARIHAAKMADGVSWWSYHNPDWTVHGLWNQRRVRVVDVRDLNSTHDAVVAAARHLRVELVPGAQVGP